MNIKVFFLKLNLTRCHGSSLQVTKTPKKYLSDPTAETPRLRQ